MKRLVALLLMVALAVGGFQVASASPASAIVSTSRCQTRGNFVDAKQSGHDARLKVTVSCTSAHGKSKAQWTQAQGNVFRSRSKGSIGTPIKGFEEASDMLFSRTPGSFTFQIPFTCTPGYHRARGTMKAEWTSGARTQSSPLRQVIAPRTYLGCDG